MTDRQVAPGLPYEARVKMALPSGSLRDHLGAFRLGESTLKGRGVQLVYEAQRLTDSWRSYLSGPDETRTEDVIDGLCRDTYDMVWFGRGGSGCGRVVDDIVRYAKTLRTPQLVMGFSDLTSLLIPLAQRCGWITFHGPVVTSIGRSEPQTNLDEILGILRGENESIEITRQDYDTSEGVLLGGNLTVLASMLGTPMAPLPAKDSIWFIEDVGESPYRLDRAFTQLCNSGLFEDATAIWVGDLGLADSGEAEALLEGFAADASCPVILGAPAGHSGRLVPLPIGGQVGIDWRRGQMHALSPWVGGRR
ncbi:MAG: S66 peptidase family protein [Bradymonadia bacterium]